MLAALAACGVLLFALSRAAPVEAAWPLERVKSTFVRKVLSRWNGLWHGVEASAENVRLRREVATLAMERAEMEAIIAENARLKESLGYFGRKMGDWLAADVLSYGGGAAGARCTVRVGRGSLAGVVEGAVVVVPAGLVGQVVSVTPHTAEVLLLSDPSFQVACTVEGDPPRRGILSGGGDEDSLVVRHLKAGLPIAPGSRVVTSGLGGVFPSGIAIGTFISEVGDRDAGRAGASGLEREGRIRPFVDPSLLEDVFIRRISGSGE